MAEMKLDLKTNKNLLCNFQHPNTVFLVWSTRSQVMGSPLCVHIHNLWQLTCVKTALTQL